MKLADKKRAWDRRREESQRKRRLVCCVEKHNATWKRVDKAI